MGTLKLYECGKCGYSRGFSLGIGMRYPRASDAMKESIEAGDYGPELKAAYDNCELPAVRPESAVYICPNCGCWDIHRDASIYEPVDVESAKKKQFGIKTVEEWGGIPYVMGYEIESGEYRLVSRYSPVCPECGEGMVRAMEKGEDEPEASALKCPRCGSLSASVAEVGFWD